MRKQLSVYALALAAVWGLAACSAGVGVGVGIGGGNSHIGVRGSVGADSGSRSEAYGQIGVGVEAGSRR
ncbi:hypothetical protein [Neisseria shayeganii]|uniref:hypothetical protein n=1 Tax=Neisseria shayeganii TaxID=607712 RepID=UPI0002D3FD0C|nr:hypothetical protein [Neisseria shayeganii]